MRARRATAASAAHRATGGTGSWGLLGPPGGDVADVAASPTAAGVVLAGVAPGGSFGGTMYRSTDAGANWAPVSDLANVSVHDIEFAPDGTAWAATQDSVWSSDDDGATWTHHVLTGVDPLNDETFDIAIDPSDSQTLWVGLTDAGGGQPVNLMRSIDGGATWEDRTPPHGAPMVGAGIAIDPGDSNTVIAVFHGDFGGGEAWVTIDGGDNWDDRSAGLPGNPLNAVVYDGTRLLVGGGQLFGGQYVGLYESTDLGVMWNPIHDNTWPILVVTAIAVDPANTDTIYVSTDGGGANRTTDGGATWDVGVSGTENVALQSIRFDPVSTDILYAGATSLGVYKSIEWRRHLRGLVERPLGACAVLDRGESGQSDADRGRIPGQQQRRRVPLCRWRRDVGPRERAADALQQGRLRARRHVVCDLERTVIGRARRSLSPRDRRHVDAARSRSGRSLRIRSRGAPLQHQRSGPDPDGRRGLRRCRQRSHDLAVDDRRRGLGQGLRRSRRRFHDRHRDRRGRHRSEHGRLVRRFHRLRTRAARSTRPTAARPGIWR